MTVLDDINSIRKEARENFSKVPLVEEFQSFYVHVETLLNLAENRLNSDYALLSSDQEQRNLLTYFQNLNFNIANELIKSNGTQWNSTLTASKHIFQIVRNIPATDKDQIKQNLNSIIKNFQTRTANQIRELEQRNKELEKRIEDLGLKLQQKEMEVTNLTSSFQQQFSSSQEKRLEDFSSLIETKTKEFEKAISDINSSSSVMLKKLEERDNKSLGLLGKISGRVFGEFYTGASNRAKWLGHTLFGCAFAYMFLLAYHIFMIIMENKTDLDWKILFYKTVVLLPLFVPAIYLIFETNRQREKEERYQELGMRISASAPYLENMEEKLLEKNMSSEKITELKIELAKKFFSEKLQHSNSHKKGFSQKEMLRLFEEMLKTLKKD